MKITVSEYKPGDAVREYARELGLDFSRSFERFVRYNLKFQHSLSVVNWENMLRRWMREDAHAGRNLYIPPPKVYTPPPYDGTPVPPPPEIWKALKRKAC